MNNKLKLEMLINEAVEQVLNEGSVHIGSIRKGIEAGRKESDHYANTETYQSQHGETFADEIKRIEQERNQKRDMEKRINSVGVYLEKVFSEKARKYYMGVEVQINDSYSARIKIEPRKSFTGSVFVVSVEKNKKPIQQEEFGIGIGAKQSIARYIKKLMQNLQN